MSEFLVAFLVLVDFANGSTAYSWLLFLGFVNLYQSLDAVAFCSCCSEEFIEVLAVCSTRNNTQILCCYIPFRKSVRNRSSFSSLFLGFLEEAQCCLCWCKEEASAEGEGGGGEQAEEQEQGEEVFL